MEKRHFVPADSLPSELLSIGLNNEYGISSSTSVNTIEKTVSSMEDEERPDVRELPTPPPPIGSKDGEVVDTDEFKDVDGET